MCKLKKIIPPQKYKQNNQYSCEHKCSDCDCVSFETIDVERREIIFKTLRNFPGPVSIFTLVGSSGFMHITAKRQMVGLSWGNQWENPKSKM